MGGAEGGSGLVIGAHPHAEGFKAMTGGEGRKKLKVRARRLIDGWDAH